MIRHFDSIQDLAKEISNEARDSRLRRYAVRFVMLSSYKQLKSLVSNLVGFDVLNYNRSHMIPLMDDALITINNSKYRNICVTYITELLRINDVSSIGARIITLCDIEKNDVLNTVIIPIVGLEVNLTNNILEKIKSSGRYPDLLQAPEKSEQRIDLIRLKNLEWLNLEKVNADSPIYDDMSFLFSIYSEYHNRYYIRFNDNNWINIYKTFISDNVFLKIEISSIQDLLRHLYQIDIPYSFNSAHVKYWKLLYIEICIGMEKGCSEFEVVNKILNVKDVNSLKDLQLIDLAFTLRNQPNSNFKTWLLLMHFSNQENSGLSLYLLNVMQEALLSAECDFETLSSQIWLLIFKIEFDKDIINSRRALLQHIHGILNLPTGSIEQALSECLANYHSIDLLTGISMIEKEYIIRNVSELNNEGILSILRSGYFPILNQYLGIKDVVHESINAENVWILDYMYQYNLSKLCNKKRIELNNLLQEKNSNINTIAKWFATFKNVSSYIADSSTIPIVWIDGLGVEWLAYFVNKLMDIQDYKVEKVAIAKVNIPSITSLNKIDNAVLSIKELDKYIHTQSPYKFPDSLVIEFNLIDTIISEIRNKISHQKFMIVSDHGFTFLSQKSFGIEKVFKFSDAEHEGRYVEIDDSTKVESCEHYVVFSQDRKQYLVASKHTSLYNTPYREVHGGITPEEALVPVIIVSRAKTTDSILECPNVFNIKDGIRIGIKPIPQKVEIEFQDSHIRYPLAYINNNWCLNISKFSTRKYFAKIIVDNSKEYEVNFEITGSIKIKSMEDLFDV